MKSILILPFFKSICGFHALRALENAPFHLSRLHLLVEHEGTTNDTVPNPEKAPQPLSRNPCTKDTAARYEFVLEKCIQIREKFDGNNIAFKAFSDQVQRQRSPSDGAWLRKRATCASFCQLLAMWLRTYRGKFPDPHSQSKPGWMVVWEVFASHFWESLGYSQIQLSCRGLGCLILLERSGTHWNLMKFAWNQV